MLDKIINNSKECPEASREIQKIQMITVKNFVFVKFPSNSPRNCNKVSPTSKGQQREAKSKGISVDMINCFFQGVNLMINSILKHKSMVEIKQKGRSRWKPFERSENCYSFDRYRAFIMR